MNTDSLLSHLLNLKTWKRCEETAPHKPLMLLFALSRVARNAPQMMPFSEVEEPMKKLLKKFGAERKSIHPEYPFWRLQTSGIWKLENIDKVCPRKSNTDQPKSELLQHNVKAGFIDSVQVLLLQNHGLALDLMPPLAKIWFGSCWESAVGAAIEASSLLSTAVEN
ncbi:hypothetical protein [Oleidesulfovibrio alaskensis]|uniref:hypothetical protein n=1 Tax=Oleidesulfovibrio alaskensis TaxID=58180 RepID=UPI001A3D1674|nr:hypothetical protein [Oleidesulfovibrio alaskensis]MBL3580828.1 hypothetical protein [Oleidesulfovibrio alaskensis]MBL3587905.1 hypothetical protein [bacterium]